MINAIDQGNGVSVTVSGGVIDLMEEFTAVIQSIRSVISKDTDEEVADMLITACGQIAYTDDESERKAILNNVAEMMDEKTKLMLLTQTILGKDD